VAVAAVLMAIGVISVDLLREGPPKILFPRPVADAGVRGASLPEPGIEIAMDAMAGGRSALRVGLR
jgi:hypothetical protein